MPKDKNSSQSKSDQEDTAQSRSEDQQGVNSSQSDEENNNKQEDELSSSGTPISPKGKEISTTFDHLVDDFAQQLETKSNGELAAISKQLDIVERAMLLEKIDNQLHTMKSTLVRPGDIASPAAAGASAAGAAAVEVNQQSSTNTDTNS